MEFLSSGSRDNQLRTTGEQNLQLATDLGRQDKAKQVRLIALEDRCAELERCNRELRARNSVLEEALHKSKERCAKERSVREQWMIYAQRIASRNGEVNSRSTTSSKQNAALPSVPVQAIENRQSGAQVADNQAIHRVGSSQSTMLEDPPSPTYLIEDDDDVPVMVSERVVRRARSAQSGSTVAVKLEPESPTITLSSDDCVDITRPALPPASSNLDSLITRFQTPKAGRVRVFEDPKQQQYDSRECVQVYAVSDFITKSALALDRSDRRTLQPISSNTVHNHTSKRVANVKRKIDSDERVVATKMPRLARDQLTSDNKIAHDVEVTDQAIMNENAVAHHDHGRPLPWSRPSLHTPAKFSPPNTTPKTVTPRNVERLSGSRRISSNKKDPPLRSRPRSSLQLHDYKKDKEFTGQPLQILDPLFSPEQRMCPSTCQRPECCGDKLRKLYAKIGKHRSKKTDENVCKQYLGPNWQNILAQLPEHRETVILQVHAMAYQKETGQTVRCGVYTNLPTSDLPMRLPNTQEREKDRMDAEDLAQRQLLERWIEAMRPNGRWRFADEVMDRV